MTHTGTNYVPGRDVAETAAAMRQALRTTFPELGRFRVSIRRFSMGCAIDVTIPTPTFPVWRAETTLGWPAWRLVLTNEARLLRERVQAVYRSFNRDNSHVQSDYFDVAFYGSADYDDALQGAAWRAAEAEYERAQVSDRAPGMIPT